MRDYGIIDKGKGGVLVTSPAEFNIKDEINRRRALSSLSDTEEARAKMTFWFAIAVMILMAVEVITALAIRSNQASVLATEQRRLEEAEKKLQDPSFIKLEKELTSLSNGVKVLKQTLDSKLDYGTFWSLIQDSQVKDVVYTAMAFDDKGNIRVDAKAPGYEKVAKQLQSLKQHECMRTKAAQQATKIACFSKVALTAVSREEAGIKFGVSFNLDQRIILEK